MAKFLDLNGLSELWAKISQKFQKKITALGILKGDGNGGVTVAEMQEVTLVDLPDISVKQDKIDATGILKGTGDGNVEAAVPGTDYLAESDLFICTVTASGTSYTADKTPQQIITAVSAGKIAVATLKSAVYFLAAGNTQFVHFARTNGATAETLRVMATGAAALTTTNLQQSALITDLEANKTGNTTYPSSKAVWDATPHPDTKTDEQTQPVSMDSDGKLWTAPSSDPDVFTGADATTAGSTGIVPAPAAGTQSRYLKGDGTWADLPSASTGARGITYLVDAINRTDTDKAVTPRALNEVRQMIPSVSNTLGTNADIVPSEKAVSDALTGYLKTAVFTATCTKDTDQPTEGVMTYTPDCTFEEMIAACNSGKAIELICNLTFRLLKVVGSTGAIFTLIGPASNLSAQTAIWVSATNKVNVTIAAIAKEDLIKTYLNRSGWVNTANTDYTTYMARGEALFDAETTPSLNGAIAWQYE